jgi:hypothetical protein
MSLFDVVFNEPGVEGRLGEGQSQDGKEPHAAFDDNNVEVPSAEVTSSNRRSKNTVEDEETCGDPSDNPPHPEERCAGCVEVSEVLSTERFRTTVRNHRPEGDARVQHSSNEKAGGDHSCEFGK